MKKDYKALAAGHVEHTLMETLRGTGGAIKSRQVMALIAVLVEQQEQLLRLQDEVERLRPAQDSGINPRKRPPEVRRPRPYEWADSVVARPL